MTADEESANTVLDENGEPFFEPIDWEMMGRKEHEAMIKRGTEEL